MDKYLMRLGTAISSAALVASSFVGPVLAVDVEISGNGADSNNTANVVVASNTTVNQTNFADIKNDVDVDANTGNNDANNNTGGDVSINTGDASANVGVNNTANSNVANVSACCPKDINVTIKDNGFNSDNEANVVASTNTTIDQDNTAKIKNKVDVDLDTGNNDANNNTGGDVAITTGNAHGAVQIANTANKNVASVGNGNGGGSLSVWISGNGANSNNTANVVVASNTTVTQTNYANIKNDVDVDANTGNNDANNNTGGDVSIDTGDASADVHIDNLANFNWADVDACGCFFDVFVKIKDNGFNSDNDANVVLASKTTVDQDNTFDCTKKHSEWSWWHEKKPCNDVDVDLDTGNNDANNNTQDGEPSITTGDAHGDVIVETTANSNVVGDADFDFDFPDLPDLDGSSASLFLLLLALFS